MRWQNNILDMDTGNKFLHRYVSTTSIILESETAKGYKVRQSETVSPSGRKLRTPKVKTAFYSLAEIKELFKPAQLQAIQAPQQDQRPPMTVTHRNIITAHNASKDGLKLGISKQARKPASNTPLFRNDNQINLF